MKINKSILSDKPHLCKTKLNLTINPETIPTLLPAKKLSIIQKGDENPFYVVEEILDITEEANGVEFTLDFWKSFIKRLKKIPIPGSKAGHSYSWGKTPDNDLYVIGAKIQENKVSLKNYIPPEGAISSNTGFIRDIKAGLIHFSIVSWTKDIVEYNEDGYIESIKAIESVKGERNDAVEVGMGAMEQKVNKKKPDKKLKKSQKEKEALIMPDNVYLDLVKNLNNQIENGTVTRKELSKDLGIDIVTDQHKDAIEFMSKINSLLGEKPLDKIKEMNQNAETVKLQAYENMREKFMSEAFGPSKVKIDGEEKVNMKRQAAEPYVSKTVQTEENLKAEIESTKKNEIILAFSFKEADVNSPYNVVNPSGKSKTTFRPERVEI